LKITVKLEGDQALIARLTAMPERVRVALVKKVTELALKLEVKVKGKLSGEVLNVRTGALRRSIFHEVYEGYDAGSGGASTTGVFGKVGSSGDVKYAGIHEFGGKTPPHVIYPVKGKALAFMMGGKQVFFAKVNHPGSVIPERSFLRSSLKDMREEITIGLTDAVNDAVSLQ
jgi:phage gpG-like protein